MIDPHKIVEKDQGVGSKKLNEVNPNLSDVPSFGVYLKVGKERVESRATNYAEMCREGERHSSFFIKPGGPFLYWTMGPGKAISHTEPVYVHIPRRSAFWLLGCGLAGALLAGFQLCRINADGRGFIGWWASVMAEDGKDAI